MTSLTYTETPARPRTGLFARLSALRARYTAARKARRDFRALLGASDHILSDIGIARGDLERALAAPIWADPSQRLTRTQR
jgi:uncharacterized protein YjiS (DUF1127 family)